MEEKKFYFNRADLTSFNSHSHLTFALISSILCVISNVYCHYYIFSFLFLFFAYRSLSMPQQAKLKLIKSFELKGKKVIVNKRQIHSIESTSSWSHTIFDNHPMTLVTLERANFELKSSTTFIIFRDSLPTSPFYVETTRPDSSVKLRAVKTFSLCCCSSKRRNCKMKLKVIFSRMLIKWNFTFLYRNIIFWHNF